MTTLCARTMTHPHPSSGARLVSHCGKALSLRHTSLDATATGGLAEVVLKQHYINPYDRPLYVSYEVPTPSEAAVGGFCFVLDGKRIEGTVEPKKLARERFERALIQGQTAALMEQQRSSVFRQEVGNIPAGAELVCEVRLDQKLRWLEEGKWEWRFPTVVAPRYLGGLAADKADTVRIAVDPDKPSQSASLNLRLGDSLAGSPHSTSHALICRREHETTFLHLAEERSDSNPLNRDLVVCWQPATPPQEIALQVGLGKTNTSFQPQAFGLVTLTPPEANRGTKAVPRELIVLLDTSGSMAGAPLRQAKHITQALIESLNDEDQLELVEFSWRASHWRPSAQAATAANKAAALRWLANLEAGGGTEMHDGIREAMQCLQPTSQRQIVLISDGLIGFEKEVIGEIANNLPSNARFFTVGVGSAVNRSLTGPAARAGRGSEFIAGLNDDAQLLAQRIVVRTKAPVLVDLKVAGSALLQCAPEKLPDLYVGCPLQLALRLKPEGGIIELRGRKNNAPWRRTVKIEALAERSQKPHLERLFARECVEDLEMRRAMGASTAAAIEEMGLRHQIATSQTSWIALSEQATVDPTSPSRHQRIGQALPQGMNAAALGLRSAAPALLQPMAWSAMPPAAPAPAAGPAPAAAKHLAPPPPSPLPPGDRQRFTTGAPPPPAMSTPAMAPPSFGSAADAEPEAESPEEEAFGPQRARRSMPLSPTSEPTVLQGRLLLLDEEMLVIEVELMQAMRWQPGAIHALLADGQRIELELDPSQTTRFGLHGAGLRLRLSLRNHQGQRPSCIDLRIAGQLHRIVIN